MASLCGYIYSQFITEGFRKAQRLHPFWVPSSRRMARWEKDALVVDSADYDMVEVCKLK